MNSGDSGIEFPVDDIYVATREEVSLDDRKHIARVLGVAESDIADEALDDLKYGPHDQAVHERWVKKAWLTPNKT